jgi:hypothetical protein
VSSFVTKLIEKLPGHPRASLPSREELEAERKKNATGEDWSWNALELYGTSGYDGGVRTPASGGRARPDGQARLPKPAAVPPEQDAAMTHAEQRIIDFLMTSHATDPVELPDWFLALVEAEDAAEPSHELITAATLMFVRRERPGIGFAAARAILAGYAADPVKLEDLAGRVTAFRLSCCFERLRRSGRYEDVLIKDPFDPNGPVVVKLTEEHWRSLHADQPAGKGRPCG